VLDGGKPYPGEGGRIDIVKPADAVIVGDRESALLDGIDDTIGDHVVDGDHGCHVRLLLHAAFCQGIPFLMLDIKGVELGKLGNLSCVETKSCRRTELLDCDLESLETPDAGAVFTVEAG